MIVFTSDHGDYLGDHWMGEKDLFHEPSVKVPLIIYDPAPQRRDARHGLRRTGRGHRPCADLPGGARRRPGAAVAPAGGPLAGALAAMAQRRPTGASSRISEYDYTLQPARRRRSASRRATRACSWSPTSAGNMSTRSASGRCCTTCNPIRMSFTTSALTRPTRPSAIGCPATRTMGPAALATRHALRATDAKRVRSREKRGVLIGVWDESDVAEELWKHYLGDDSL